MVEEKMTSKPDFIQQIIIDDTADNLKQILSSSNKAKDMIVASLKKGKDHKKYNVEDVIAFLEGCRFRLETEDEGGAPIHNLVFKIPTEEKTK